MDEIGAYQTEGSNWNIAGSRDPGPCLVLGFVGNGALGAKPGTETLDCASSPIPLAPSGSATTRSRQLPTILRPPPPLFPPFVAFLHFQPLPSAAILYRRQEPIYLQRSPSFTLFLSLSLCLGNEVQIRYSQQWCTDG